MKKIAIVLMFLSGVAQAQESPMLDFGSFFMKSRIGYSVNQHYERSTVLYSAFKRYKPIKDVELLNLNFGYDTTSKHPVVAIGIRLDNADRLLWSGEWAKKHIESAPLPVIEFGPYLAAWPKVVSGKVHLDYWYGFILAMGVK